MIKPADLDYEDSKVVGVNEDLTKRETYTQMNFVFDYSIPAARAHARLHNDRMHSRRR